MPSSPTLTVGTAGWSIPRAEASAFPGVGSHLQRYARTLNGVEINSSFYRPHQPETYARWAAETPPDFQFSVKLPKAVTHEAALVGTRELLVPFLEGIAQLGPRLRVLLIQLPPSLAWERRTAAAFFRLLSGLTSVPAVCEPRHASWFTPEADEQLRAARIGRVAADPSRHPDGDLPGGWLGASGDGAGALVYRRWHGAPRLYWSSYDDDWLQSRADELLRWSDAAQHWVIFDNTASGAAATNALDFQALCGVYRDAS
ncbi:DUF72 domain-containing protein [Roseateles terrae]|uniref:Uncharacterized protein YecE (DUF72 family) n=1 Tax=Roseateles terrae TaxID=431060 RepID=A0ABR6GXB7_9BURK|nr:DUF72 domain-containing protein [Roseateles terrae]MBB3196747.1 uncharacterized protein YecE (DUF72 family) [Roseateles terrae]OWQ84982.1 hypothetical protein CDN98_18230 [Roseateles terrae]